MKNFLLINVLCASMMLTACESTKVGYFVEPQEGMRYNLSSQGAQSGGDVWGNLALLALGAYAIHRASCRKAGYRYDSYGSSVYDSGTC